MTHTEYRIFIHVKYRININKTNYLIEQSSIRYSLYLNQDYGNQAIPISSGFSERFYVFMHQHT